jgi:TonB family protein
VVLSIVIGEDGDIRDVEVVKGSPILAEAATTAVHQWHYQPYLLNGTPVSAEGKITVNFVLPKGSGPDSSDKEKPTNR